MNNFYFIGYVENISDISIDYYNKCRMSVVIECRQKNNFFKVICSEKMIDKVYKFLKVGSKVFVSGRVEKEYIVANKIVLLQLT